MFKTKRRKELERKEDELYLLKQSINEMRVWCAADSGEIAYAMLYLQNENRSWIETFRGRLRQGLYTFENYRKEER